MDRERRSTKFRSWLKKPFKSSSQTKLKIADPLELDAASSANENSSDGHVENELPTAVESGNKPEASSEARNAPVQASESPTPSNADAGNNAFPRQAVSVRGSSGVPTAPIPTAGALPGGGTEAVVSIVELWNEAFEELRKRDPKLIEKYEEQLSWSVSTMVGTTVTISGLGKVRRKEQMEVLVKRMVEEDENGKWRIPFGDDRIAIRDLARSVVSIVDWGKEFVGAALEPSPYGSLAWAGVCLLLPLILNPSKQRASNVAGLEYISDLLSRCAIYENGYRRRYESGNHEGPSNLSMLSSDGYKSALKELYIRILRFQAQSVCQFSRNLASGTARAMFKMDDWDALLGEIKSQEGNCQTFFDAVKDQEALDEREEGHRQRTSLLLEKLKELRDVIEEVHLSEEASKCFEILRTSDYVSRKNLNPPRLPDTCNWFLDHPKYQGWTSQPPTSRLLWVSADPGCGKSVLAKALVDQYERGSVCYYFFKDDDVVSRSPSHALCALLHQICDARPALIRHVLPMYRRNGTKLVDLFEELWSIFVNVIDDEEFGNIICILDAIDECSDSQQKVLLRKFAAIATSSTSIKILITSRPYNSIESALFYKTGLDKNRINLAGEAKAEKSLIEEEISLVITSRIQEFQKLRGINDDVHQILQHRCDEIKNRTYLWVSAIFDALERDAGAPKWILIDTIKTLPDNVDKAYENILKKTSTKPFLEKTLKTTLHIMLAALRPLSLLEMNVALSTQRATQNSISNDTYPKDSFHKWIRDLCGFFINIIDDELYFVHQTAREFLIGEEGYRPAAGWRGSFQQADSHTLLTLICIDCLVLFDRDPTNAGFRDYAIYYWVAHCQSIEFNQQLAAKVKSFLFQDGSVAPSFTKWMLDVREMVPLQLQFWAYKVKMGQALSSPPTPLFLACAFGWSSIINFMITTSKNKWNQLNIEGSTGLHIAVSYGHLDIVKHLLTAGIDVNIQDKFGKTALHLAVMHGNLEIVKHLLTAGIDVNIQDKFGKTALHLVVKYWNPEVAKHLLAAGIDVNIQDHTGETALHWAVKIPTIANLEIVGHLLTARIDVNIRDKAGNTALHSAVKKQYLAIVKHLLAVGIDVNIQDDCKETALHLAVKQQNPTIVKHLLTAGIDANIRNRVENTALHLAVKQQNPKIVKHLLAAGIDVNIRDKVGNTALHLAVERQNLEIVEHLLTAEIDVNIQNKIGKTALHMAVENQDLEAVKLLLKAGADIEIKGFWGYTALQLAKQRGFSEIVETLLAAGARDSEPELSYSSMESLVDDPTIQVLRQPGPHDLQLL